MAGQPLTRTEARSVCRWQAQSKPKHGIGLVSRTAARRSKIRPGFVVRRIWLISAIPTATSSAHFIGQQPPEIPVGRTARCGGPSQQPHRWRDLTLGRRGKIPARRERFERRYEGKVVIQNVVGFVLGNLPAILFIAAFVLAAITRSPSY